MDYICGIVIWGILIVVLEIQISLSEKKIQKLENRIKEMEK